MVDARKVVGGSDGELFSLVEEEAKGDSVQEFIPFIVGAGDFSGGRSEVAADKDALDVGFNTSLADGFEIISFAVD